jgi:streptogramin lyase
VANVGVENTTVEVAIGGGFVWATDLAGLAKVNLETNMKVADIEGRYLSIVGGPDGVWAFEPDVGRIVSIDAKTNDRSPVASVAGGVSDLRYDDGYLWYTNARGVGGANADVGVFRVDPETGETRPFNPESVPGGCSLEGCERSILALGNGAAWYLNEARTVTRMDMTTREDQRIPVPKARGVAFGDGYVWILLLSRPAVHPAGSRQDGAGE